MTSATSWPNCVSRVARIRPSDGKTVYSKFWLFQVNRAYIASWVMLGRSCRWDGNTGIHLMLRFQEKNLLLELGHFVMFATHCLNLKVVLLRTVFFQMTVLQSVKAESSALTSKLICCRHELTQYKASTSMTSIYSPTHSMNCVIFGKWVFWI